MTTLQAPPTVHTRPGSTNVPVAQFPPAAEADYGSVQAYKEAAAVVDALNQAITRADYQAMAALFVKDGFWRDHLALTWEFRTLQGRDSILEFLQSCAKSRDGFRLKLVRVARGTPTREPQLVPIDGDARVQGIQAFLSFDTVVGSGEGTMRLVLGPDGWRIFTLYTSLRELKGHEENTHHRRPLGVEPHKQEKPGSKSWTEKRRQEAEFNDGREPSVLIVGAGHAGLSMAARLQALGMQVLVVERNHRVGDNWRCRYDSLALHDPVWYHPMPYLAYPPQWPVFSPKDKFGQFLETYANLLDLNVWTRATLGDMQWDEKTRAWTVSVLRKLQDGSSQARLLHPRHIVQATGHAGDKYQPSIKGLDAFQGDRLCHSTEYSCPQKLKDSGSKKAVIIGSCNSGHDIAQDFVERGYHVTMVQRSSTTVTSSHGMTEVVFKSLYSEDGPPVEDGDLLFHGLPISVLKAVQVKVAELVRELDRDTLVGLEKVGFKVDHGPDNAGLVFQYFQRGGGYYIDVGASKLIADGRIKVRQGIEVAEILPHGVRLADGSELEADEVILATGYQTMTSHTRQMFGDAVADRVNDVWGFNAEGEMRTMWQPSGHPGFWLHGGNIALCRFYSRLLALQIKAQEEGLYRHGER